MIFQGLRLKGSINYYQRKSGVEIDFILNKEEAYEVKLNPTANELKKLKELSKKIGMKSLYLVSLNYTTLPNTIYGFEL